MTKLPTELARLAELRSQAGAAPTIPSKAATAERRSLVSLEVERAVKTRTTWVLAGAMLVLAVIVAAGANHQAVAGAAAPAGENFRRALDGIASLRVFVVLLGVLCVTSEYHHGDIVWRYLAEPGRSNLVRAKAGAWAVIGSLLGLGALQLGALLSHSHLGGGLSSSVATHTVVGAVLCAGLAGALGVGIGAALRNQTTAVVGTLVAVLVVEPLIASIAPGVGAFLPSAAAAAASGHPSTLGWGAGLLVFAGYTVAAVALGGRLCTRNDV